MLTNATQANWTETWTNDRNTPIPDNLPQVMNYYMLVIPLAPPKTIGKLGRIILTEESQEIESYQIRVGKLVAKGPAAYKRQDLAMNTKEPSPGDYVVYKPNAGIPTHYKGVKLLFMTDFDIIGITDEPEAFTQYWQPNH